MLASNDYLVLLLLFNFDLLKITPNANTEETNKTPIKIFLPVIIFFSDEFSLERLAFTSCNSSIGSGIGCVCIVVKSIIFYNFYLLVF